MNPAPCDVVGVGVIAVDDMFYVDPYPLVANFKQRVRERLRQGEGTLSCGRAETASGWLPSLPPGGAATPTPSTPDS